LRWNEKKKGEEFSLNLIIWRNCTKRKILQQKKI